jgi:hypothetical protein
MYYIVVSIKTSRLYIISDNTHLGLKCVHLFFVGNEAQILRHNFNCSFCDLTHSVYVTVVVTHIHVWPTHTNVGGRVTTIMAHTALSLQGTANPVSFKIISLRNHVQLGSRYIALLTM